MGGLTCSESLKAREIQTREQATRELQEATAHNTVLRLERDQEMTSQSNALQVQNRTRL